MKLKTFLATLGVVGLVSACSDSDHPAINTPEEGKAVFLQIKSGKQGETRAAEPSQTGEAAELLSAIIYFLNDANVVEEVRTVGSEAGADATIESLEDGTQFTNIPPSVTRVYVVGNYNSADQAGVDADFPTAAGTTLSDIEGVVLNIQQVAYPALAAAGTGAAAPTGLLTVMTGNAALVEYASDPDGWEGVGTPANEDFYAEMTLVPINSRLEILEITYTGTAYTSFTLEGIYINNFYAQLPLSLDTDGYTVTNSGSDPDLYTPGNAASPYNYYTTLYDAVGTTPSPVGTAITSGAGTWAYHVFSDTDEVPHIVLKLTALTTAGGTTVATPRYVTVTGFLQGGTPVTTFARNTIYQIADLSFGDGDITVLPETENINVWIAVEVQPWLTVPVTPII
ncbi:MAG: hypothetical protein LUD74_05410 [Tannerellaceae bacterium]|nr:hypothetical protein [Tannerellaceae bacterium]